MSDDRDDLPEDDDYEEFDDLDGDDYDGDDYDDVDFAQLDDTESALVQQDLIDLDKFEATFHAEGYKGVSVYCQDCAEDHFYPWDMLRGSLEMLLQTGEAPVHEPAYQPDPDDYVPWEYARGYVDALQDVGVASRRDIEACPRCQFRLPDDLEQGNFCPRCGTPMLSERLRMALVDRGFSAREADDVLREGGLPT